MYILSMMFILYCRDMREVGGGEGVGAWCGTDEGVHACMYVDRGEGGGRLGWRAVVVPLARKVGVKGSVRSL